MNCKPIFANLRNNAPALTAVKEGCPAPGRPISREGRKQIAVSFTPEMLLAMHMLARRQDRSLQALMAEAFNDVLRKYGESLIGK